MGNGWAGWLLCVTSIAVAFVFAVRTVRVRGDRAADAAHTLMGLGMAGMFAPWGDPVPAWLGTAVFAMVAAWFGARYLRGQAAGAGGPEHLVLAPAAMVFMYLSMSGGSADGAQGVVGSGHAAHAAGSTEGPTGTGLLGVLFLLVASYFVWHAWHSAGRLRIPVAAGPDGSAGGMSAAVRVEPVAHAVMSGLMATMFLLAV